MKLQILVNHYNESKEIVDRFLQSLATQKDCQFEVFICGDGGLKLEKQDLEGYPFDIHYAYKPHTGVCNTRNVMFDIATSEYIMFCDIDDAFSKDDGLASLVKAAEESGADVIGSPYDAEMNTNGELKRTVLKYDTLRVHGKIFRREFLLQNEIRFPDEMETSGDMMFLWLVYSLSNNIKWIDNNFYIWKHNPNSVTRQTKDFAVATYDRTLRCYTLLAEDLERRNRPDLLQNLIATVFGMMYVQSTHPYWKLTSKEAQKKANIAIKKFLSRYYEFYKTIDENFRREKYLLMLNYLKSQKLSGAFEGMIPWAESRLHHEVLIVGYGVVGHNLARDMEALRPAVYDKYKNVDTRSSGRYSIAFICVDTPKTEASLCDTTEVKNAIMENDADVYILKSTILPGVTEKLCEETGKTVIFSPEYYGGTQHCNNYEFDYTILGGDRKACLKVVQMLQKVYDGRHQFRITDAKTAELAKYMENSYLATKVSFCNQFFDIAEKIGVDYEELRELFVLDPRVEPSHTFVYRDHPYWDSHCLNKDVPAIAEECGADLLKSVIEFNEKQKKARFL